MAEPESIAISAPVKCFCDYKAGMCGDSDARLDPLPRREMIAYHEAGHAVISYALGFGCSEICLTTETKYEGGKWQTRDHAHHKPNQKAVHKIDRRRSRRRFNTRLLALGVMTAAGPAAQRSFCQARGYPPSNFTYEDDREVLDLLAESIATAARSRFARSAYRRLVWRRAQMALTEPRIWRAICELGRALNDGHWPADVRETGTKTGTMCGATARSIIRKAGIFPGMLGEKVREISRESLSRRLQNGIMRAPRGPG
jgi:hypothetical protein